MRAALIFAILLGLSGVAVLASLGVWQVQRMYEKRVQIDGMLAGLGAKISPLPAVPDPVADRYRPVTAEGSFTGEQVYVLSGQPMIGGGVEVISVLHTSDGRRILVDRGFLPNDDKNRDLTQRTARIIGNLLWPQDSNAYTPPPDPATGLWFARDLPAMAQFLNTEPTLIVAREPTGDGIEAMPIDTSTIPNDHWGYAITWFSLAVVWSVMTGVFMWRITRRTV